MGENLFETEKCEVYKMLVSSQLAISKSEFKFSKAAVILHKIELLDHTLVWQRPKRFSDSLNNEIDRRQELLNLNIIEKSISPCSSPVVPALKMLEN